MKKESFTGRWGFILAAAGSAIGLGNVWRFPYYCGQYGGLSFILMYLFVLLVICNPLMVAEIALGRASKSNFIDAYQVVGQRAGVKHLKLWSFCGGWMALIGLLMIVSFYFLVAGWVLFYFLETINHHLFTLSESGFAEEFNHLTQSFSVQYVSGCFFLLTTALIVAAGVKQGIEKASKYAMPVLFLIFILLSVRSLTLSNAEEGIKFLTHIDWKFFGFTENGFAPMMLFDTFVAALGQAFISLSLGFGVLLVYGSYFSAKENLFKAAYQIEIFDTVAAILSAIIILPAIFAVGLSPSSGPGLTFISLPMVFQQLSGGYYWGLAFYLLLIIATLTSTISVFEAMTNLFMDKLKFTRFGAVSLVLLLSGVGFTAVTVSFSGLWEIKILGRDIFSLFDYLSSTYTIAIVSLTMALFVGYKAMKQIMYNIRKSAPVTTVFTRYFLFTLRVLAPLGLVLLLVLAFEKVLS
ncbi:MAG: sodium-dependent transporter [Alphaproteobacteria bacterium]|nr:sodium-dependent transporter [Alphaproteobacteria bacterium]